MSTTIFVPTPLTSAEQAEALPKGTIAQSHGSDGTVSHACLRVGGGWWCTDETNRDGTPFLVPHVGMVHDTALVPVEVEVEYIRETGARRREKTLYVTPWKDPR